MVYRDSEFQVAYLRQWCVCETSYLYTDQACVIVFQMRGGGGRGKADSVCLHVLIWYGFSILCG